MCRVTGRWAGQRSGLHAAAAAHKTPPSSPASHGILSLPGTPSFAQLEARLLPLGVLQRPGENSDDEAERRELAARTLRQGGSRRPQRTESDEDSDFSD